MTAQTPDAERLVDLSDEDSTLPDSASDDTDLGWSERPGRTDDWLRDERPPHWD